MATKSYSKFGEEVVAQNHKAIELGAGALVEVSVPAAWANAGEDAPEAPATGAREDLVHFVNTIVKPVGRMDGDSLPVSAFADMADGTMPQGSTAYEKRGVACFIDDMRRYRGDKLFVIALDEIELITYNTATSETWKSLDAYKGLWSALRGCGCPLVVCGVNSTINEISNLTFNGEQCDNPMYGRIMNCSESGKTYLPAFTDDQTKEMINTLGKYSTLLDKVQIRYNKLRKLKIA